MMGRRKSIGVLLFPGFELLDVFGPLEMFGIASDAFEICLVSEASNIVQSSQGPKSVADATFAEKRQFDIILVPGGQGTRAEVENRSVLGWIQGQTAGTEYVTAVCTGSALLARAGVLDGRRATTNKIAWQWATAQGPEVSWQKQARWVEDGMFFTSSGVSAGMDMSLALIGKILGDDVARKIAVHAEYEWHRDAKWDPFAKIHGLI